MQATQRRILDLPLARMIITEPDTFIWIASLADAYGEMATKKPQALRLMKNLDAKLMMPPCSGNCGNPATHAAVYNTTVMMTCWCDACNPHQLGADRGKLTLLRGYLDVLNYAGTHLSGKATKKKLLREWAGLKGWPQRFGTLEEANYLSELMVE